jgi:hypothetical protein
MALYIFNVTHTCGHRAAHQAKLPRRNPRAYAVGRKAELAGAPCEECAPPLDAAPVLLRR